MNREEWRQVETQLSHPWGRANLRVDGHDLTLNVQRSKGLQFAIYVYVDGWMKGEHMSADSNIGAKFYRPTVSSLYSGSFAKKMEKAVGKRELARLKKKHPPKVIMHSPSFPSVPVLRRHLAKTCISVELVSCGYVANTAKIQEGVTPCSSAT